MSADKLIEGIHTKEQVAKLDVLCRILNDVFSQIELLECDVCERLRCDGSDLVKRSRLWSDLNSVWCGLEDVTHQVVELVELAEQGGGVGAR